MPSTSLSSVLHQKKHYKDTIKSLISDSRPKVAFHFNCCDGIVSAAIVYKLFEKTDLLFLPIDYPIIRDKDIALDLSQSNWHTIVDLEPFNSEELELFADHHISNQNKEIKAKTSYFTAGAPSTAFLLSQAFHSQLPEHLLELAKITEITDTASYKIPPPTVFKENQEKYTWDERIWLLEDACKTTFTVKNHQKLIKILADEGWEGLWKKDILKRIKNLRYGRSQAIDIANQIEITNFPIIIDKPVHHNLTFIAYEIMRQGSIGTAYLTVYPSITRISLRLSKSLSDEEIEKYRVDLLAKKMSGGGHKPASGAQTDNLEIALETIQKWAKKVGLSSSVADLRDF